MKVRYITIEREYGSGGSKIARETAKRCGAASYGREIMETVAKEQGMSLEALEKYEENVSGSLLYSMFAMTQAKNGDPDLLSPQAKLYVAETRVIKELAEQGPGIFVGHCAAQTLKDMDGVLRVFIRASEEEKQKRAIEDYGILPDQVDSVCRKSDRRRAQYYSFCTGKKWDDPNNYDIVLDSTRLGIEGCAAALSALYTGSMN